MKNIDTVIFDLDGTLLNTIDDLTDSVNFALKQKGYPTHTSDKVKTFVGEGVRLLVGRAVPANTKKVDIDAVLALFEAHYNKNKSNKTRPYDGIFDLLESLFRHGIVMAIVSNKYDTAVKALCKELFGKWIPTAIGERDGVRKKPAPDMVDEALKILGKTKQGCVYVGDSDIDCLTAKNSGLPCVAVTWGFRDRVFLETLSPAFIIDTPSQLLDILRGSPECP